ncbi:MAG: hypothetical protein NTU60_02885, partial [Candidatus Aminicenantes bacterium]|nr:hypothetical protein [Candidatus Aminicenantes bacterium]
MSTKYIAKWDGSVWTSLGSGMSSDVYALTVSGTDVYAGGYFAMAGGVPANFIAKFNGKAWSALGSGMDNGVRELAANGADIYCGGQFFVAGDKPSHNFAIWHANLALTSPNGGEIWEAGTAHAITWLSQPTVGDIKIEYSTDGGGSWMTIAASTSNDGSYDWVVPSVNSTNALVRVSEAADGDPSDVSAAAFSIATQPTIVVMSPNGGESWFQVSSHNITWSSTLDVGNVKIEYSTADGTNYAVIIASTPNTGRFHWTVPNSLSANCLVRISSAAGGSPSDVSDAVFAIAAGPVIRLSRANLTFGAIIGGHTFSGQSVIVSNAGGGTLNWTATSNKSWMSFPSSSGSGTGTIWVYVSAEGLSAGAQTGMITVSDPNATNSPQTINVALTVKNSGLAPFGEFSTPLEGATGITGAIPVTGWVLDDVEVMKVEIKRDPDASDPVGAIGPDGLVFIGYAIFVEGARPDIETGYPDYPLNYKAGWGYMLLTNFLPNQGNGTYKLYAYAYDSDYVHYGYYTKGNIILLGSKTITCSNATAAKPFGTIDTPEQGGDASRSYYVNFGWVLTPMPKTVPKDGSTIDVYVDSTKVGNLTTAPNVYNQYRVDVATAFPGLNNSSGPVGAFYLDTTKYANGVHTIYWSATDDQGAADGIGSRYFNIINTGTAAQASSQAINLGKADSYESVMNLPVSFEPRKAKIGFNLKREPEILQPDNYGTLQIEIKEVERVEVELGKGRGIRGFLVVGEELRSLPIGSTLDQRTGTFSWMPGPGFLGTFDLVFVREAGLGIST